MGRVSSLDPKDGPPGFWLIDTMYKEYPNPEGVLNSLSWEQIPNFIVAMAKRKQEDEMYDLWKSKELGMSYPDFKKMVKGSMGTTQSKHKKTLTKEQIKKREEKSNLNFISIEEWQSKKKKRA